MKTIIMTADYNFRVSRNVIISYKAGEIYPRVTEAQAAAIIKAKAGKVKDQDE